MADDHPQRPFRSTDLQSRATPTANNPSAGSNDPLAELARLIGQSDPFGEFGRDSAPQPAAPQPANQPEPMLRALAAQAMPRGAGTDHIAGGDHGAEPAAYGAEEFGRQPFGSAPLTGGDEVYQMQGAVPGYEQHAGYQDAGYDPNMPPYTDDEHAYYDDVPPPRRRMGVMAIAAVFALAVIGTAGAFGYRALFGSAGSGPPPVIKADSKPAKVLPEKDKDQSAKLINDRVNDAGGQKLVSREERPVDLNKTKPAGVLTPDQASIAGAAGMQTPALGSGVIGPDPKKVHTITIRPDQPVAPDGNAAAPLAPQANVANAMPAQPAAPTAPAPPPARMSHTAEPAAKPAPAPRPTVTHRPAPRRVARAPTSNAPLSLTPDAVARTAPAPARTATPTRLAPTPSRAASGGYAVQISSRRNRADAEAALRRVQGRFASVIGGQQVMIRRVDLGTKGIYYRAMVGPFGSSEAASQLCSRLKAAGGSCFVQKI